MPSALVAGYPKPEVARTYSNLWRGGRELKVGGKETAWVWGTKTEFGDFLCHHVLDIVASATQSFFLVGILQYVDPLGIRRERGFTFIANRAIRSARRWMAEFACSWTRVDGDAWNYDRRVKKPEAEKAELTQIPPDPRA